MVHHPFDPHDPLRPAKAAKCCGALGVGAQPVRGDADVIEVIGVIRMQHGTVGDGQGQVHRPATAGVMGEIQRLDPAIGVEANGIVDAEIMAFACHDHIVVTVIAHLAGASCARGCDGAGHGERVALTFLAAKTPAHAPGLYPYGMHRGAKRLCHLMLNLGRVLGRGMDDHIAIILRQGEGGLTFEVEMLLSADIDRPAQALGGGGQRGCGVAFLVDAGAVFEAGLGGQRLFNGKDRGGWGDVHRPKPSRVACRKVGRRDNHEHRLARVMYRVGGQQRFVMVGRRYVIVKRQICRRQYRHHTGGGSDIAQVHAVERARGHRAQAKGDVQRCGRCRDVIDIPGSPRNMELGGVMG